MPEGRRFDRSALRRPACRGRAEERGGPERVGARAGLRRGGDGFAAAASQALGEPAISGWRGARLPVSVSPEPGSLRARRGRPSLPAGGRAQRSGLPVRAAPAQRGPKALVGPGGAERVVRGAAVQPASWGGV